MRSNIISSSLHILLNQLLLCLRDPYPTVRGVNGSPSAHQALLCFCSSCEEKHLIEAVMIFSIPAFMVNKICLIISVSSISKSPVFLVNLTGHVLARNRQWLLPGLKSDTTEMSLWICHVPINTSSISFLFFCDRHYRSPSPLYFLPEPGIADSLLVLAIAAILPLLSFCSLLPYLLIYSSSRLSLLIEFGNEIAHHELYVDLMMKVDSRLNRTISPASLLMEGVKIWTILEALLKPNRGIKSWQSEYHWLIKVALACPS